MRKGTGGIADVYIRVGKSASRQARAIWVVVVCIVDVDWSFVFSNFRKSKLGRMA